MSSILQARGRAANIASAYANAKQEHIILSSQDESCDYKMGIAPTPALAPPDGTQGRRDKDIIPVEWYHCPYTAELAKGVGKLVGELGRAQASSQKSLNDMEKALEEKIKRLDSKPDKAALEARSKAAGIWWGTQKAERVAAFKKAKARALAKSKRRK
jgi:hypothetical protein